MSTSSAGKRRLQLVEIAGADDGRGDCGMRHDPSHSQGRRMYALFPRMGAEIVCRLVIVRQAINA